MKRFFFFVLMLAVPVLAMAASDILWSRTFGGSAFDGCASVQLTSDGGYILAGHTESFGAGNSDMWLVKTDANGDSLWSRTFGGSNDELCHCVQQTSDGGYFLVGTTYSFGAGSRDIWLVKTDANGNSLWSHTYGGSDAEFGFSGQQTSDGGYVVGGYTQSFGAGNFDIWLVKTDANGDSLWSRTFGGGGNRKEVCTSVQQTSDGGYILAGVLEFFGTGNSDLLLVKTDVNGDSLWGRIYGGSLFESCLDVQQTPDGGYILAGTTGPFLAGQDFWLVKTDENGDSLWSRAYGGTGSESANSVRQTPDGGYIMGGWTDSFGAGQDAWLVKVNSNGGLIWNQTFGGSGMEWGAFVEVTSDSGYILGISTASFGAGNFDFWLIKMGPDEPKSGYVTLISHGPPNWGYRLHHMEGSVGQLIFTDFCPGTVGSVGGDAATAGWTVTNYSSLIVFTATTPLTSGTIDTFWLSHPTCSDYVTWAAGDSSGAIEGPLPVEMMTFQAFAGDGQVTLRWQTASEQDNDHFVLYRRNAREENFHKLAEVPGHRTTTEIHDYEYVDQWVQNGVTYEYQISDVDIIGRETFYEHIISATPGREAVPRDYALYQNHPNPFNPATEIVYDVKEAGQVTLKVFNLLGQEIATLVDAVQSPQRYHVSFDGSTLASGVYLCTIQVNDFYATRKMVLLK